MADYRLIYSNLKTGEILGEAPAISVSMTEGLNTVGSLSATLLLEDVSTIEAPDGAGGSTEITTPQSITLEGFAPVRTGIYLERDGEILFGGMLWTMELSVASGTVSIGASGFMSYLRRLPNFQDLTFSGVDQGLIAKALLEQAMALGGADIGLTAATPAPSVSRDRTYPAQERKSLGEAIEQLAAVDGGFVWRFEHSWNVDRSGIDSVLRIDTSPLGRLTSYVFELGVNMSLLDLSVDGTTMANYAEAWGQGEGGEGFYRSSYNAASVVDFPLIASIQTFSDVKTFDNLSAKAAEITARGASPLRRIQLEVFPDAVPALGSYEVGDRVEVRGAYGALSVNGTWRIVELGLNVQTDGLEEVKLALAPQEVF